MKLKLIALSTMAAFSTSAFAEVELYKDDKTTINFSGALTASLVNGEDSDGDSYSEITDNFNRIYFSMNSELKDGWSAIAKLEWKVRLTENDSDLGISQNGQSTSVTTGDADQSLSNRLGYVGVTHDKWGTITIGKQWGSSYLATAATDSFMIYGGEGLGIFDLGDGGFTGVARAEKALQYSNKFSNLTVSAQVQVSNTDVDYVDDTGRDIIVDSDGSVGLGANYAIGEKINVALGYNSVSYDRDILDAAGTVTSTEDVDSIMTAATLTYGAREGQGLYAAVVVVDGENHHKDNNSNFLDDSTGYEVMVAYRFDNDFEVIGGAVGVTTDDSGNGYDINDDYETSYLIAGVAYYWSDNFRVFSEVKIDDSTYVNADGSSFTPDNDMLGVGARYSF